MRRKMIIRCGRGRMLAGLLMLVALTGLSACSEDAPIMIGFSGPLEGTYSDIGVEGRNGVLLAFEEINDRGGLDGSPLQLVIRHDGTDAEDAARADQELIDSGVAAIIGHMTSSQSLAGLAVVQEQGVIMLSPTTSTPLLSGIKDCFFRVMPSSDIWAMALASYILSNRGVRTPLLVGDMDNSGYTQSFLNAFEQTLLDGGGSPAARLSFSSSSLVSWDFVMEAQERTQADCIVLAASSRDVAEFAKRFRLAHPDMLLVAAPWALTKDIVPHGGHSVEGLLSALSYSEELDSERYRRFRERFASRFGSLPGFAAAFSYDAAYALFQALSLSQKSGIPLEEALVSLGWLQGVMGDYQIDEYGDVERPSFILTIKDGALTVVDIIGQ